MTLTHLGGGGQTTYLNDPITHLPMMKNESPYSQESHDDSQAENDGNDDLEDGDDTNDKDDDDDLTKSVGM